MDTIFDLTTLTIFRQRYFGNLTPSKIPEGECHCGCGMKTSVAKSTEKKEGRIKGRPCRYVFGHNRGSSGDTPYYTVDKVTGCWVWMKSLDECGYGWAFFQGKHRRAHALYYLLKTNLPVPDGCELDHLCRNRRCVNPEHLQPISHTENIRRGALAKLTAEKVAEIRLLHAVGNRTLQSLADQFHITKASIWKIVAGRSWKPIALQEPT